MLRPMHKREDIISQAGDPWGAASGYSSCVTGLITKLTPKFVFS